MSSSFIQYLHSFLRDYDLEQIKELQYGIKAGLDISYYLDPKLSSSQMGWIRMGLAEGLPVKYYANPTFSKERMSNYYYILKEYPETPIESFDSLSDEELEIFYKDLRIEKAYQEFLQISFDDKDCVAKTFGGWVKGIPKRAMIQYFNQHSKGAEWLQEKYNLSNKNTITM